MKSLTIRDLRLHWPAAEKSLQIENELLITRDGQPVAKLVLWEEPAPKRTRWDPEKHAARIRKIVAGRMFSGSDERLAMDRADRNL